jgi:glycosyltransferase involved in cell wall biosynthesis
MGRASLGEPEKGKGLTVTNAFYDRITTDAAGAEARRPVVFQLATQLAIGPLTRDIVAAAAAVHDSGGTALVLSPAGPGARDLARAGGHHLPLALDRNGFWARRRLARDLAQQVQRFQADVIHAHDVQSARIAHATLRTLPKQARPAFLFSFRESLPAKAWRQRWRRRLLAAADWLVVGSEFSADEARHLAPRADRVQLVAPGIDTVSFDPAHVGPERITTLARQWRLPDGVPLLLMPGSIRRPRGHELFVDGLAQIKEVDFRALMVGDDESDASFMRELKARIERHGLAERVFIVDHCRDLPAAMMLADVIVSTSESPLHFDRVFAQAQAMGRPVVVSEHGSAAEQASRGAMVWLTPPGNPYSVAEALESAMRYPAAERVRLAQMAQTGARTFYSRNAAAQRMVQLYRQSIETRQALKSA